MSETYDGWLAQASDELLTAKDALREVIGSLGLAQHFAPSDQAAAELSMLRARLDQMCDELTALTPGSLRSRVADLLAAAEASTKE